MMRRAFIMMDTIIYVALLSTVSAILLTFIVGAARQDTKNKATIEVGQNSLFAIERINSAVRNAKTATVPAVGASGPVLSLTMADAAVSPTVFQVTNGVLTMKQGAGPAVPLTSTAVSASGLLFQNLLDPVVDLRTEPVVVPCQANQNKRLICHGGNTQCVSKNSKLAVGDALGPCFVTTSAKSTIRTSITLSAPSSAAIGNEYSSSVTLYGTSTIPRQN